MRKKLAKLLAGLLCVGMVLQGVEFPVIAAGSENEAEEQYGEELDGDAESFLLVADSWVNPIYEDMLPDTFGEQLRAEAEELALWMQDWQTFDARYYTVEEAADLLREYMVEREETVTINVEITIPEGEQNVDYNALLGSAFREMRTKANEETSTSASTEGDYLRFHQFGCGYSGRYYYPVDGKMKADLVFTPHYTSTREQEERVTAKLEDLYAGELDMTGKNDYEKISALYGYVADHVTYDYAALEDGGTEDRPQAWSAYGGLIDGTCVCQGYSVLLYRMMKENGISVRVITGLGGGGAHAWNIVGYNGLYYNMDSTWDGYTINSNGEKQSGYRDWFMLSPDDFTKHTREAEYETLDFHRQYPMSETSYGKEGASASDDLINLSNIERYNLTELDGSILSNQAEDGKCKLLIAGRVTGSNTKNFISEIKNKDLQNNRKLDIIYVDYDGNTKENVQAFKTALDCDIKYCYGEDSRGDELAWEYLWESGVTGSFTPPCVVLIDGSNQVRLITYGAKAANKVFEILGVLLAPEVPVIDNVDIDNLSGSIAISWNPVDGADSYNVYRAVSANAAMQKIATVADSEFTDSLTTVGTYYYAVSAVAGGIESARSQKTAVSFTKEEEAVFRIEYVLNGGDNAPDNPSSYKKSGTVTLKDPTRAGYEFDGWYTDAGMAESARITVIPQGSIGDKTLYAKWTPIKYTINFDGNGSTSGSMSAMADCVYGTEYTLAVNTYKKGDSEFLGWNTRADGRGVSYADGESVKNLTAVSGDSVTLYAQWSDSVFTITYMLDGGINDDDNPEIYSTVGDTITLNDPTREGYTFDGWYSDSVFTERVTAIVKGTTGNKTLYAKWTAVKYAITYNLNGGVNNSGNPSDYDVTMSTIALKNPTRTGHTFDGWYSESSFKTKVSAIEKGSIGNKTLYAKWTANKYTIQFNGNGATSGSMSSMAGRSYGTSYQLAANAYKREGYNFVGWNTKADGSGTSYANKASVKNLTAASGGSVTLYAQWSLVKYTITYKLNGGKNNKSNPASYSVTTKKITLKKPTRTGYTFGGWYSNSSYKTKVTTIAKGSTGNKKLYAKWTANKYSIKFNGNGATSGKMSAMTNRSYDKSYSLTANAYKRAGYTFVGWNTKANGSGTFYTNKAKVKNLTAKSGGSVTLYAQWKRIKK